MLSVVLFFSPDGGVAPVASVASTAITGVSTGGAARVAHPNERRLDTDGRPYTAAAFQEHYGEGWEASLFLLVITPAHATPHSCRFFFFLSFPPHMPHPIICRIDGICLVHFTSSVGGEGRSGAKAAGGWRRRRRR